MTSEAADRQVILVADPDVLERHGVSSYLRDCGYVVVEASTSGEAVQVMERPDFRLDAVLCDIAIGGQMNGFELRQWAARHRPGLEVILAGTMTKTVQAAAELCDEGPHLARPYDPQAVVDYIKRLFGRREAGETSSKPT